MSGPRIGSLFSGAGMLDEGVRTVLGGTMAWHSEVDPAACKVLAHRYPDVPNIGDVTAVDWSSVEPVDVITGGSPCQDVSAAGKRAGMRAGTRSGLWASMVDAIDILRPSLVVWENVRGALSAEADSALEPCAGCVGDGDDGPVLRALGRVLGDLAELGYDASWHGLRAADVGAPHGRYRIFVAAHPGRGQQPRVASARHGLPVAAERGGRVVADSLGGRRDGGSHEPQWPTVRRTAAAGPGSDSAADAARDGRDEGWPESARLVRGPDAAERGTGVDANADRDSLRLEPVAEPGSSGASVAGLDVQWGVYEPAIRQWERLTRPAPSPTETGPKGGRRLSPRFTEWMQGWPDGWVTDVPGVSRNDALKICGNGVVPQQAAEALRRLMTSMESAA